MDGFTIANVDTLFSPYIERSYTAYYNEYLSIIVESLDLTKMSSDEYKKAFEKAKTRAELKAMNKIRKEVLQCCEQIEYKFNTIASSRGDFSFITCTFGLDTTKWGRMFSECLMETRAKGQGDPAVPMLFPKLVFMASLDDLHGEGKPNHDLFVKATECSNVCMYPDYISLHYTEENENYIGRIYKKYGKAIAPMGKELLQLM